MPRPVKKHVERRARFDKRPIDPEIAILNTGTIRTGFSRGYAKKQRRDQPAKNGKWCLDCGKQGYSTEEAARDVLGTVAKKGNLTEAGSFAAQPYMCGHGWWHFGRNARVLKAFSDLRKQREKANFPISHQPDRLGVERAKPVAAKPGRTLDVHNAISSAKKPDGRMASSSGQGQDPAQAQAPEVLRRGHAIPFLPGTNPVSHHMCQP